MAVVSPRRARDSRPSPGGRVEVNRVSVMARKIRRENLRSLWLHRLLDVGLNWLAVTLAYLIKEGFQVGIPTEPVTGQVVVHTFAVTALIWLAVASAMEATARQPEASGKILVNMMAGCALIEALTIYVLVVVFVLSGKIV